MAFNRLLLGAALVGFLATPAHAVVKQYRLELIDLANFIDDDGNDGVQTPGTAAEPINGDFQFTTDLSRIGETIAPDFASLVLDFGTRVASFDSGNVNVSINPAIPGLSPPADSSQSVILVEGGEPFSEPGGDPVFGEIKTVTDPLPLPVAELRARDAKLVSGFPFQQTGSFGERLLLPLIHFVLLGFLPVRWMRQSLSPAYGAGCGQWFIADRDAYHQAGGHAAIRDTLHDGIRLPRAFRKAGFRTDIFDATWLATCRMYHGSIATWQGLLKNAHEGMASNGQLPFWLFVLGLGQVAPLPLFAIGFVSGWPGLAVAMLGLASALCYWPRLLALSRFAHPVDSVLLHPLGIAVLLAIQVHAGGRRTLGLASTWKGRAYGPGTIQS